MFGGTLWFLNTPSPHRARPFHSHSIQTQASPFHLSRSVIRSITLFFFWVGHLFQPFFIVWCVDCLFCRIPGPIQSFVTGTGTHPDSFHCHRVPDSFQLHVFGFVEVHHRGPLDCQSSIGICSISGVFSGRAGIGRFSWALQDPARNHPPAGVVWNHMGFPSCIPVFSFFELVLLHVGGWRMNVIG